MFVSHVNKCRIVLIITCLEDFSTDKNNNQIFSSEMNSSQLLSLWKPCI